MSTVWITGPWFYVQAELKPLEVSERKSLLKHADTTVFLAHGPDGLPIVLDVRRHASVVAPVRNALGVSPTGEMPERISRALSALDREVRDTQRSLGIAKVAGRRVYKTGSSVHSLFGDTLLARLLGRTSPLLLDEDRPFISSDEVAAKTSAGVLRSVAEVREMLARVDTRACLAVPLEEGPVQVVPEPPPGGAIAPAPPRPLITEDLRALPSVEFHARRTQAELAGPEVRGALADIARYEETIRSFDQLAWSVSRHDLCGALVQVARAVHQFHEGGRIHGDLKPNNLLLTKDGARPFDSLDIAIGAVATAGTPGWSAPEQVIARPVSPATDVYALGLLAVSIAKGSVFGEERSFVVPVGKSERKRMRLLAEPDVFLDPTVLPLDDVARQGWRAFLASCLCFDAEQRIPTAVAFADGLEALIERHPLPERVAVTSLVGRLRRYVSLLGRVQPAWVVADGRAGLPRSVGTGEDDTWRMH